MIYGVVSFIICWALLMLAVRYAIKLQRRHPNLKPTQLATVHFIETGLSRWMSAVINRKPRSQQIALARTLIDEVRNTVTQGDCDSFAIGALDLCDHLERAIGREYGAL